MRATPLEQIALDFVEEVLFVRDRQSVGDLLLEHARSLGLDFLVICDLPLPAQAFRVYLCNWPRPFLEEFQDRLHKHAPIMRHAASTTEPFVWADVKWDRSKNSPEQRVMNAAAAYGLQDGFVVPIIGLEGEQSCIGLSGRRSDLTEGERRALHLMCLYAHHAVRRRKAASATSKAIELAQVQRDCLSYIFMGYPRPAIADRLSLSGAEVTRLVRSAARRLGVSSVEEAAVRAAVLGEISP